VFVDPFSRRQKSQQDEQGAEAITPGSERRLAVARIIEKPIAGMHLSPRKQDHKETSRKQ
jgi:hypothetical protein